MSQASDAQAFDLRLEKALRLLTLLVEQGKHYPAPAVFRQLAQLRRACARSDAARGCKRPKLRLVK